MITEILHTTFLSSDLLKSCEFYHVVLGLKVNSSRPKMSFDGLWFDVAPNQQIHIMLLPNPEIGLNRPLHGGRDRHVAFSIKNISKLMEKLNQAGIPYTLSQSGRHALFCRDPDNNALEFIESID